MPKVLYAEFSYDDNYVVLLSGNGISVLNLNNRKFVLKKQYSADIDQYTKMLISFDNKYLFVRSGKNEITKFDISAGDVSNILTFDNDIYEWYLNGDNVYILFCLERLWYDGMKAKIDYEMKVFDINSDSEKLTKVFEKVFIITSAFNYNEIFVLFDGNFLYL